MSYGSRKGGQSAVAKHKYQTRQGLYLVGKEGVRDDLAAQGSGNLPAFAEGSADAYWLAVDSFERADGRLYNTFELNLPRELTLEQQKNAVQNYMKSLCDKEKLTYSWVIHHPKDGKNAHAHVMINEQKNDLIDRPAEQHFMRWNSKHPERGGAQKSRSLQPRRWLMHARAEWAIAANDALEAAGFERHFDHRTLKEQRVSALLAKDWRKAAELDREVCQHEGPRVAGVRRKYEAGQIDRLPEYAASVIESNDQIKKINARHLDMVASMTDAELEHWERAAYFDALAEHEPNRLAAELEQLHTEALELDALYEQHSEALELDALYEQHSEALELDALYKLHSEGLELDAVFEQHSEALELDALYELHSEGLELDAVFEQHSEALELDALYEQHSEALELDALYEQHSEALELDALYELHSEALELDALYEQHTEALELDAQDLDPDPEPPQAQEPAADFLEDETMPEPTLQQRQQAALAAMREAKAPFLRLVEPNERAPEPQAQAEAIEPEAESQLTQLREQLKAQDAQLERLAGQQQEAIRFAVGEAEKLAVHEKAYKKSLEDQKSLEAQAAAAEPRGFARLVAFVARALGYRTESDKLRAQAVLKAGERFESMRAPLLSAKSHSESAEKAASEARRDLAAGKTQRAELVDAVLLASGSSTLKKAVAIEVEKLEKLESDFEKLGSSKAFELKEQRLAITQAPEPSDAELLQQSKDLQKLAQGAGSDYRSERFSAARQARERAELAYHAARIAIKEAGKLDDGYKKAVWQSMGDHRDEYFAALLDPKKREDPELFKALEESSLQLESQVRADTAQRQEAAAEHKAQREQRPEPRQRQEQKSDFRL
jgi:hypothetical protein